MNDLCESLCWKVIYIQNYKNRITNRVIQLTFCLMQARAQVLLCDLRDSLSAINNQLLFTGASQEMLMSNEHISRNPDLLGSLS